MKREGRQHGTVSSHSIMPPPCNPRHKSKPLDVSDSSLVAGDRARAISKPTNHSKFTGKCRKARCLECHLQPVSKSRTKAKGAHKLKSGDVSLNHRLISWRAVDKGDELKNYGMSASEILKHLIGDLCEEVCDEHEEVGNYVEDDFQEGEEGRQLLAHGGEEEDSDSDFCEVGFLVEFSDGGDWCVVTEI